MTLVLFEGAAGTGKTTRLLAALRDRVVAAPLVGEQRVLALTKYHGSRKRMESKLGGRTGLGRLVDCITIDSFAWHLVRRWRALVRHLGGNPQEGDYQSITATAGMLLRQAHVGAWVGRRYPVIAVDELQDCKGGEVEILAGLLPCTHIVGAADSFQDLSGDDECAAVGWARTAGEVIVLDHNHRTSTAGLIAAARALRDRCEVRSDRDAGFEVIAVPTAPVGGSSLAWRIKLWSDGGEIAIISPTKPGTSPFVDDLLRWVATKTASTKKSNATAGPFRLEWEAADEQLRTDMENALALPAAPDAFVACAVLADTSRRVGAPELRMWAEREGNVRGRDSVTVADVRAQVAQVIHRRRAFGRSRERQRFALTVHQAKNREFQSVVVLWPLRVQPDAEQQRRLLYNGITRARQQALVIVEDPKRNRLDSAPFRSS